MSLSPLGVGCQPTPKKLPRMQCARAIPVAWLGSGSCQNRPSGWILMMMMISISFFSITICNLLIDFLFCFKLLGLVSQHQCSLLIQSSITDAIKSQQSTVTLSNTLSRVWSLLSTCMFGGEHSGTGTVLCPRISVNPCQLSFHKWPVLFVFHPVDAQCAHYRRHYIRSYIQFSLKCIKIGHSLQLNSWFSTIKLLNKIVVIMDHAVLNSCLSVKFASFFC